MKIQATANSDKIEYGEAEVQTISSDKLFLKALARLTICWCIAIVCILIPILHFILVPAFFFLGIYLAVRTTKLKNEIVSGTIRCPHCSQIVNLPKSAASWPHTEICQNCSPMLKISPATA